MKKMVILPLMLVSLITVAQTFQPGIKAGVNVSNFTGGDFNTVEHNALVGFHRGGLLRFKFNNFVL
jgi:hypothetical protein